MFNRTLRAQSLAEYALALGLVAIVVIVIAFGIGLADQRIFGLVAGALGAKHDTQGGHYITIDSAPCISVAATQQTGLYVTGTYGGMDISDLTGSSQFGLMGVEVNGTPGNFVYHPMISSTAADLGLCPKSVVIQGKDGSLAEAPLTLEAR